VDDHRILARFKEEFQLQQMYVFDPDQSDRAAPAKGKKLRK
jgi:hypothetical protein